MTTTTLRRIVTVAPLTIQTLAGTTAMLGRTFASHVTDVTRLALAYVRGDLETVELEHHDVPDYDDPTEHWPIPYSLAPRPTTTEVKGSNRPGQHLAMPTLPDGTPLEWQWLDRDDLDRIEVR